MNNQNEKIIERYLTYFTRIQDLDLDCIDTNDIKINLNDEQQVLRIFQAIDWSFTAEDTAYFSHDIHPYPAKFPPQIPAQVISILSDLGERVWDPFGGSGTTVLEAILRNRTCVSTDLNPIGEIIGKAKTTGLTSEDEMELDRFITRLEYYDLNKDELGVYIKRHLDDINCEIPNIPNIEKWFEEPVICELAFLKVLIKSELMSETNKNIAKASLSKIVTKVSNQESETTYRAKKRETYVGETVAIFLKDLKINYLKIKDLSSVIGYRSCEFITTNVMEEIVGEKNKIKNDSVDLIITSPPYPNAFDYHLYHRFRIFWLNGDPRKMGQEEIGSHLKYQKRKFNFEQYKIEMAPVLRNCFKALKSGRYAVFILGDAVFDGKEYKTAKEIGEVAEKIGFNLIGIVDRNLPENKRTVKSWARRATTEQILILRKPVSLSAIQLHKVEYKLQPYEKTISDLEKEALLGEKRDMFNTLDIDVLKNLKKLTFYKGYSINGTYADTWQRILEHSQDNESDRKESKYLTHGVHPYKGKFYPQLVRPLLNILHIEKGARVFDPFCGSGTVLLEATLNGYKGYGCDINPTAVEIAKVKNNIFRVSPYDFEKHINLFKQELANYANFDYHEVFDKESIGEIESWFPIKVINKMAFILKKIETVPNKQIQDFLRIILSSIIREISQQDPSDLRIRRRKEQIDDADVLGIYMSNLDKQYNNIMVYFSVCQNAPTKLESAKVWRGNSTDTQLVKQNIGNREIDIVITSPPYATALPYIDTNRLNMLVLDGINATKRVPIEAEMTGTREIKKGIRSIYERKIEEGNYGEITSNCAKEIIYKIYTQNKNADVGFRRKNMSALVYMYFHDMTKVMNTIDEIIKENGYICIVIGDTKTTTGEEKVVIKTTEMLRETGRNMGWTLEYDIPISVTIEKYKHMKNSITENNILVFKK